MATSSDIGTVFNCPICLEKLVVPKYLPCLHTFCKLCIQSFIKTFDKKGEPKKPNYFECPVCRLEVPSPETNISAEDWADKLPINHLLLSLQDATERLNDAQEGVLCEPCKRAAETNDAKFYCRECKDSLCENCLTFFHKRIRHYECHTVMDISRCPQEILMREMSDVEDLCMIHKTKALEVYCFDHQVLCCSICFATQHRKCNEVKSLDEVAEEMGENIPLGSIDSALTSIKTKVVMEAETTLKNCKELEDKHKEIKETVVNLVEEAKCKLDTLRDKFLKEFQIKHDDEMALLSNTQEFLDGYSKALSRSEKILTFSASSGNRQQLFLTVERIKMEVSNHLDQLNKQIKNQSQIDYQWKENSIIKSLFEKNSLGNLEIHKTKRNIVDNLRKEVDSFKKTTSLPKPQKSLPEKKSPPVSSANKETLSESTPRQSASASQVHTNQETIGVPTPRQSANASKVNIIQEIFGVSTPRQSASASKVNIIKEPLNWSTPRQSASASKVHTNQEISWTLNGPTLKQSASMSKVNLNMVNQETFNIPTSKQSTSASKVPSSVLIQRKPMSSNQTPLNKIDSGWFDPLIASNCENRRYHTHQNEVRKH